MTKVRTYDESPVISKDATWDWTADDFEYINWLEASKLGAVREAADYTMFDHGYVDTHSSTQELEVAACRAFYTDERPLAVVDADEVFFAKDQSELVLSPKDVEEVAAWLSKYGAYNMFDPYVADRDGKLVLVY